MEWWGEWRVKIGEELLPRGGRDQGDFAYDLHTKQTQNPGRDLGETTGYPVFRLSVMAEF